MKPRIAAIGTFDGLHQGHQSVLKVLTERAKDYEMEPMVITFDRHPLALIDPERTPKALMSLEQKQSLLKEIGVVPVVLNFDEPLRSTNAEQWMKRLNKEWGVEVLVVGYDNTFGCDGINMSIEDYKKIGEKEGIKVITADEMPGVSSSAIRKAVLEGEMEKAGELLGRPYSITAKVTQGNQVGQNLGFPTANIDPPKGLALPKPGVYAAIVKIENDPDKHIAMVNIGTHPTVMSVEHPLIEAHILDWTGDLYGKDLTVRFLKRMRDEKKFENLEDLKAQLAHDKKTVESLNIKV